MAKSRGSSLFQVTKYRLLAVLLLHALVGDLNGVVAISIGSFDLGDDVSLLEGDHSGRDGKTLRREP